MKNTEFYACILIAVNKKTLIRLQHTNNELQLMQFKPVSVANQAKQNWQDFCKEVCLQ